MTYAVLALDQIDNVGRVAREGSAARTLDDLRQLLVHRSLGLRDGKYDVDVLLFGDLQTNSYSKFLTLFKILFLIKKL